MYFVDVMKTYYLPLSVIVFIDWVTIGKDRHTEVKMSQRMTFSWYIIFNFIISALKIRIMYILFIPALKINKIIWKCDKKCSEYGKSLKNASKWKIKVFYFLKYLLHETNYVGTWNTLF